MSWRYGFFEALPQLGHRNWLVVADSAYPKQSKRGIDIIVADEDHLSVLTEVARILEAAHHVQPIAFLDKELDFLTEDFCPGIDEIRAGIYKCLEAVPTETRLHEELLPKLAQATEEYNVYIIKTKSVIPYTSVFFQLECGYWTPEQETRLRKRMSDTAT